MPARVEPGVIPHLLPLVTDKRSKHSNSSNELLDELLKEKINGLRLVLIRNQIKLQRINNL